MRRTLLIAALLAPSLGLAAGSSSTTPPAKTETTQVCGEGMLWNAELLACDDPETSSLSTEVRYLAVRELAYAGDYAGAARVLETMDQASDAVLTYWGFIYRKQGKLTQAAAAYTAALDTNPDNLLARSYYGQGLVADGQSDAAMEQLQEIRKRGGTGTWPAIALAHAIRSGRGYSY